MPRQRPEVEARDAMATMLLDLLEAVGAGGCFTRCCLCGPQGLWAASGGEGLPRLPEAARDCGWVEQVHF